MGVFSSRSKSRLPPPNERDRQQQRNNNLGDCFAYPLISLPLRALFGVQAPVLRNSGRPSSPQNGTSGFCFELRPLMRSFAAELRRRRRQERESQRTPYTPYPPSPVVPFPGRQFTRDSGSEYSPRTPRTPRTHYSQMVSPSGSACNLQSGARTPAIPQSLATTPSVGAPARNPTIGYLTTPITPLPPPPPCGHAPSGLGRICGKCVETATACEQWMSGIEEAESTYEQEPPGFEPIPETPPGEDQSSPLLSPNERREGPPIGLGIMMSGAPYEEQSLLLTGPLLELPPTSKKRKRKPAPLSTVGSEGRFPWGFKKNRDTASATLCNKRTGTTFAPECVQNVREDRSTFESFREMSCTLDHCTIHGGGRDPSIAAPTIVSSNGDSCTTLAASVHGRGEDRWPACRSDSGRAMSRTLGYRRRGRYGGDWDPSVATAIDNNRYSGATLAAMHSESEDRSGYKQHAGEMDCALKHCDCGGRRVGVGDQLESSRNGRGVSWVVDGFLAALTKGISWLRGKRWRR